MILVGTITTEDWSGKDHVVVTQPGGERMPVAAWVQKHVGRSGEARITIAIPGVRTVATTGELECRFQVRGGTSADVGLEHDVVFRVGDLDVLAGLRRHVGKSVILEIRAT